MREWHKNDVYKEAVRKRKGSVRTKIDKDILTRLYCYEHKLIKEIAKELKVKPSTVSRELKRHNIEKVFYRQCPQCGEWYIVPMRSMVNENSNKFKKFCSRSCFLSSRQQCDTWIETEVYNYLKNKNITVEKQFEIERMTVDFLVKGTNIVIEVNGDFWHANPEIYGNKKPLHKIHPRIIAKDKRKLEQLNRLGFKVITVWENDLKTNRDETLNNLYYQIKRAV